MVSVMVVALEIAAELLVQVKCTISPLIDHLKDGDGGDVNPVNVPVKLPL